MDWIVFGDDWGAHPSTTQHLVSNFPPEDRVVWIDSIGMRSPGLSLADCKRLLNKGRELARYGLRAGPDSAITRPRLKGFARVKPPVLPWHLSRGVRAVNRRTLKRLVEDALVSAGAGLDPTVMVCNPAAVAYVDDLPGAHLVYLRLDDYARLPGVDPRVVSMFEPLAFERADVIAVTADALRPPREFASKTLYLPQGVDVDHFAAADLRPSRRRVLGFFGLIAEWIDFELIESVARAAPDWHLEFIGPVRHLPDGVKALPNVSFMPGVPFSQLPTAVSDWTAAWIPFVVSPLTDAVNPLKAREYLAAGLATHCTPLPEVRKLGDSVMITADPARIVAWLNDTFDADSVAARARTRLSVAQDSWAQRCATLRQAVLSS